MFLKSLQLENFGIVKKADLQLSKGWNLFSGNTGQGKSTVLKSLAYLLVGYTPKTIEDFLNWNADKFSVKAKWDYEGIPFSYDTTFDRKGSKSDREVTVGSETPYLGSDATKKIAEYFDPSLCRAAIMSFQNESDLVTLDPAKRRELLKKIYTLEFQNQIDLLKQEIDNVNKKVIETDNAVIVLRTRITGYKIEELLSLPFEELDYRLKKDKMEKLRDSVTWIEKAIKEYDQTKADIQSKQLYINSEKAHRKETETAIFQAQTQITEYKHLLAKDSFYSRRDKLQEDLNQDFEAAKRAFETELNQIVLTRVVKFDEAKLQASNDVRESLSYDLKKLEAKIAACKSGECPVCGHQYKEDEIETDDHNLILIRYSLKECQENIDALSKQKRETEQKQQENADKVHRMEILKGKIENEIRMIAQKRMNLQNQLEAEEKSIVKMKETIRLRIDVEIEKLKAATDKQTAIDLSIEEKEKEILLLKIKLPENRPEVNKGTLREIDEIAQELKDFDTVVIRNSEIEIRNVLAEKNKKTDEEKLSKVIDLKAELLQEIENHKTAQSIYKIHFPNYVINDMVADIEQGVNSFLDRTYEGRYHVAIKESKTGLSIVYGPRDKDISTVASGGEIDIFNVGLKIAFCKLSGMKILILDEVDKYFDDEIAVNTFGVINDMLHNGDFDQILVVSHKNEVKDIVEQFGATVFEFKNGVVNG